MNMDLKDDTETTATESETERRVLASAKDKKVSLVTDKKNDLLLSNRLSENRGKDDIHVRAKKLKEHYRAVQACDKIMAYGFIMILFLLTGFYWFIIIFNEQIRNTFHEYHLIAPTFVFGTLSLGTLNIIFR